MLKKNKLGPDTNFGNPQDLAQIITSQRTKQWVSWGWLWADITTTYPHTPNHNKHPDKKKQN